MKSKLVLGIGILLIFGLVGCGGASSLVGKWVPEAGQRIPSSFIERRMELTKDGTGIGDGLSFTWKAENGRLTFNLSIGQGYAYNYKISGSTLTLTDDNGTSIKYKKE